jgi:uncharacterized protein (DUF3820 family)
MSDERYLYRLESVLPFKKHKGKKLKDVIDEDIEYIKWLHKKGSSDPSFGFRLGKMALDYLIEKNKKIDKKTLL